MLLKNLFMFVSENLLLSILIAIVVIYFCIQIYKNSLKSRKYYKCPNCGESFRSEYMESKCCKVCGSELIETDDKNVNDKAV